MARKRRRRRTASGTSLTSFVRERQRPHGVAYFLDLRHRRWEAVRPIFKSGMVVIRDPADPGWPKRGKPARSPDVARAWVESSYSEWMGRLLDGAERQDTGRITVSDGGEIYLAEEARLSGESHNTYRIRKYAIRGRIRHGLGTVPLLALTKVSVKEFLSNLKRKDGTPVSASYRDTFRDALRAIWRAAVPAHLECPFGGEMFPRPRESAKRRKRALEGHLPTEGAIAFSAAETTRLIVAAMSYDRNVLGRPNLRQYNPITPIIIALQLLTGVRIEELTLLRWKHVDFDQMAIFIPGTKTSNAVRWVPLQTALVPWLDELRAMVGEVSPDSFLIQLRRTPSLAPASTSTLIRRIGFISAAAGLKRPGKATHILRATFSTRLMGEACPPTWHKVYMGHASWETVTAGYIEYGAALIPVQHRDLLRLPRPNEISALASGRLLD